MSLLTRINNATGDTGFLYRFLFMMVILPSLIIMSILLMYVIYICGGRSIDQIESAPSSQKIISTMGVFFVCTIITVLISIYVI